MRWVRLEASPPRLLRGLCILLSSCEHSKCCLCFMSCLTHPPSCPAFPRRDFAFRAFPRHVTACSTMRALTPVGPSQVRQVSPLTPLCLPNIPLPTTLCARTSRFLITPAHPIGSLRSGLSPSPLCPKASPPMSRLAALTPPNRIRHPTGCSFASGCSPPRLTTTQLPSATHVVTPHGTDFHHADKATSRPHSFPVKTGNPVLHGIWVTGSPAFAGDDTALIPVVIPSERNPL
jgi:hypothetical protein